MVTGMNESGWEGVDVFWEVFYPYFAVGTLGALLSLCLGVFRFRVLGQIVFLLLATIALWMGLAFGVHMGYGAWQGLPDPGAKAYADGANLTGAFMFGWIPAGVVCFAVLLLLLLGKKLFGRGPELPT
jgi:mannose/fructose/N-acetylgalactosamine-specific phosphotransferase system component IID